MSEYNLIKKVDYDRLEYLFNEVGWSDKTKDRERLKAMVRNSQVVVTAWEDDLMVGFARCVTDFVFNGQIYNVVVDSHFRGQGIGKGMVTRILKSSNQVTYILRGDPDNIDFYTSLGFKLADNSLVCKRLK